MPTRRVSSSHPVPVHHAAHNSSFPCQTTHVYSMADRARRPEAAVAEAGAPCLWGWLTITSPRLPHDTAARSILLFSVHSRSARTSWPPWSLPSHFAWHPRRPSRPLIALRSNVCAWHPDRSLRSRRPNRPFFALGAQLDVDDGALANLLFESANLLLKARYHVVDLLLQICDLFRRFARAQRQRVRSSLRTCMQRLFKLHATTTQLHAPAI